MILLDTHVWLWWLYDDPKLPRGLRQYLTDHQYEQYAVSVVSYWEIAKLNEKKRIHLHLPLEAWTQESKSYPLLRILELTPEIAVRSTMLPEFPNRDPGDELIVASALHYDLSLATCDRKLLQYKHVKCVAF